MWGVVLMFVVGCEFGSERILNDIIPYESKILRGLPRRASIVFIRETPIPIRFAFGIRNLNDLAKRRV
jgi:hypothetical protein